MIACKRGGVAFIRYRFAISAVRRRPTRRTATREARALLPPTANFRYNRAPLFRKIAAERWRRRRATQHSVVRSRYYIVRNVWMGRNKFLYLLYCTIIIRDHETNFDCFPAAGSGVERRGAGEVPHDNHPRGDCRPCRAGEVSGRALLGQCGFQRRVGRGSGAGLRRHGVDLRAARRRGVGPLVGRGREARRGEQDGRGATAGLGRQVSLRSVVAHVQRVGLPFVAAGGVSVEKDRQSR